MGEGISASACHVLPRSVERSILRNQRFFSGVPTSRLDGASQLPSRVTNILFLIGPRMPSGRRVGGLQWRPPSVEVMTMPHQSRGLGPIL
jgi:hypothetical protein